jgi:hypothetical protein
MRTLAVRSARPRAGHSGAMSFFIYDCTRALALAVAVTVCQGRAGAQNVANGGGGGAPLLVTSGAHASYASTDVRADAAPQLYQGATADDAEPPLAITGSSGALVINATFDSSITSDPQSAAIEAMINDAISVNESRFNDPITVSILFRYATTAPNGTPLPSGILAYSTSVVYMIPWNTFINALTADATTANDATANASLPGSALSTNIDPSSANGRAVGLNTPPAMQADGSIPGGPYDGIVTVNSGQPFQFTRPPTPSTYDALRATEHEMDEVLGFGSSIGLFSDLRPQDLFSWSAPGTRNVTTTGLRYFSINGGVTNIVGFNQDPSGDFGDWLSGSCPQVNPYVQNAFSCEDQASDVIATSPEGINRDVIGYDLINVGPTPTPTQVGFCGGTQATCTVTATSTLAASATSTVTATPTTTGTPTLTPTAINTYTGTPTSTATATATPTITATAANTHTATLTSTVTATPTTTATFTTTLTATNTRTVRSTPTGTLTVTSIPSPSPTATSVFMACVGDCTGSGMVNIADLVTGVNIALGSLPVSACPAFENAQGTVDIAQLIKGVDNALNGCGSG